MIKGQEFINQINHSHVATLKCIYSRNAMNSWLNSTSLNPIIISVRGKSYEL